MAVDKQFERHIKRIGTFNQIQHLTQYRQASRNSNGHAIDMQLQCVGMQFTIEMQIDMTKVAIEMQVT
eukprot:9468319-Pyramimonas_sp.AAC.1